MFRNILNALTSAVRTLFGNGKMVAAFVVLYATFIFALYLFFTTSEANIWKIALSILLTIVLLSLFFVLQAMGVNYSAQERKLSTLLTQSAREFWKLLVLTLPIIILAGLVIWGVNKLGTSFTTGIREAALSAGAEAKIKAGEERIKTLELITTIVTALLIYFIVPLFSIHLWIATLRDGIWQTLKGFGRIILRAFAPRSVLTYLLGFLVFGVIPYFIITTRTLLKNPWLDLSVLGFRITLALLIGLLGWVVTVGTLSLLTIEKTEVAENV